MANYYISDLHLFHESIIRMCNRPFKSIDEMHDTIMQNWNNKVKPENTVYILGDVCLKCPEPNKVIEILKGLNGQKHLILGNHDHLKNDRAFQSCFESISQYKEVDDNGTRVVLFHYPMEDWAGRFRGSIHLFGHVHNNRACIHDWFFPNRYNVSIEDIEYEPKTLSELLELREQQLKYQDKVSPFHYLHGGDLIDEFFKNKYKKEGI